MYRYIKAMSREKRKIEDSICDKASQIDNHMLKLLMYPDDKSVSHWKKEIYSFVNSVYRLKSNNKFPSKKSIISWLQIGNDMLRELKIQAEAEESELTPRDIDLEACLRCIEEYQIWLADILSQHGVVTPQDVYSKLDEIIDSTL